MFEVDDRSCHLHSLNLSRYLAKPVIFLKAPHQPFFFFLFRLSSEPSASALHHCLTHVCAFWSTALFTEATAGLCILVQE